MKIYFGFEYVFELHYLNIKLKIIREEYLKSNDKGGIIDYIVYCYNGKAKNIGFFSNFSCKLENIILNGIIII